MKNIRFPGFCMFPGYRWCGPGCSGPGDPINKVDQACKEHDECYSLHSNSSRCECDIDFMRKLDAYRNPHTEEGRRASAMYHYMRVQSFFRCRF